MFAGVRGKGSNSEEGLAIAWYNTLVSGLWWHLYGNPLVDFVEVISIIHFPMWRVTIRSPAYERK
jgi:hypothetical protein